MLAVAGRGRSEPPRARPSTESSIPIVGCVGCLGIAALVLVDALPFLVLQGALAPGRHSGWADVVVAVLGLAAGPIVAGLVGYLAFSARDRLLAAIDARWPGISERENAVALDPTELSAVVALVLALGAGAAVGSGAVVVLDAVLH